MTDGPSTLRRGIAPPETREPEERKVTEEKKAAAPVTRVKSAGRINRRLEMLAESYERNNPGQSVRWVYDPTHKPDMSNILSRQIDGFRLILVKDLDKETLGGMPGLKPDDPVRVGDTVMMAIAEVERQEMREALDRATADEMTRVEQEYNQAVEEITTVKGGKEYRARPMGTSVTEAVEREVAGPDSHKVDPDS